MTKSPQPNGVDEDKAFAELFGGRNAQRTWVKPSTPVLFIKMDTSRATCINWATKGSAESIDEVEFLNAPGPKVVLGEPGMGKTELIREFGRRLEVEPVGAIRFMLSKDPIEFVQPGKPLHVDALDEAMSRREGDAIDVILSQLEAAGAPDFILSCRAREWQARGATSSRRFTVNRRSSRWNRFRGLQRSRSWNGVIVRLMPKLCCRTSTSTTCLTSIETR